MKPEKLPNLFRPLAFYHPAPDNSGIALSFSYNSSEDKLYLNLLRQTGWDEETQRGFFSGEDKKVVKFSQLEAATLARRLENHEFFTTIHTFNNIRNFIEFQPLEENYSIKIEHSVNNEKTMFETYLDIGEVNILRLYIEAALHESFYRVD